MVSQKKKTYDLGTCCLHQREWLYKAKQTRNAVAVHFLIHLRLSLRCAPASAGQRIYRRLPQGALFSPVGLPRRPAALAQGAGVPDAEDLGRPFATAAWRGEARSSHCWRKVGVCVCDEN